MSPPPPTGVVCRHPPREALQNGVCLCFFSRLKCEQPIRLNEFPSPPQRNTVGHLVLQLLEMFLFFHVIIRVKKMLWIPMDS